MHPNSYINSNGNASFSNMQSIMENSSYNNGNFFADDGGDRFNGHVILENKRLRGKKSSKKDRHSKIETARGPRDRRMRLSIDVAKRFFKLQDMLGFDKASNTIQWLLMKSKPAIRALQPQQLSQSCSLMGVSNSQSCRSNKEKKRVERGVRNIVHIDHSLVKETREKARARARKRTTEKRSIKLGCDGAGSGQYSQLRPSVGQVFDQNTNRLEPRIPFVEDQVRLTDQIEYSNYSYLQFKQQIVGDTSSMMSSDWSPSFLFNCQHSLGPCHEHQFQ